MSQRQLLAIPTPSRGIRVTLVADPEKRQRLEISIREARAAYRVALLDYATSDAGVRDRENYCPFDDEPLVSEEWSKVVAAKESLDDAKDHLRVYDETERLRKRFEKEGRP